MATSPVAKDPTETKDETAKDNTENQGNVQVLLQILRQNFNLITELLFSIQCSKKTFLTGDEKEIKEISLWRQKEYCQLATPQRPQYRPKGYKQSNQQQIPAGWKEILKKKINCVETNNQTSFTFCRMYPYTIMKPNFKNIKLQN